MSPLELVKQRYTTKHYDPSKPLTQEEIQTLMEVLRLSPSSVNSQPWHFYVAQTPEAREKLMPAVLDFNQERVRKAGLLVVLACRDTFPDAYFEQLLDQEDRDGRYSDPNTKAAQDQGRRYFAGLHMGSTQDLVEWTSRQTYIALGFVLYAAAQMGIDSTCLEGLDYAKMDELLHLKGSGYRTAVAVSFGHRDSADANATRPKSRLCASDVVTWL